MEDSITLLDALDPNALAICRLNIVLETIFFRPMSVKYIKSLKSCILPDFILEFQEMNLGLLITWSHYGNANIWPGKGWHH